MVESESGASFGLVDAHTHADMMAFHGWAELGAMGVSHVVTHACVFGATGRASYLDHYARLLTRYRQTAAEHLIDLRVCLGIHPLGIPPDWEQVVAELPRLLAADGVAGIGEVGLHTGSELEQRVLAAQLKVAARLALPVSIHLPPVERAGVVGRVLDIIAETGLPPELACVEHAGLDMAAEVAAAGCWLGLSLGPGRLDAAQLAANEQAFERGMLSSDYVNFLPRDWAAVPKAAYGLKRLGASPGYVRRVASENAATFYRLYFSAGG